MGRLMSGHEIFVDFIAKNVTGNGLHILNILPDTHTKKSNPSTSGRILRLYKSAGVQVV